MVWVGASVLQMTCFKLLFTTAAILALVSVLASKEPGHGDVPGTDGLPKKVASAKAKVATRDVLPGIDTEPLFRFDYPYQTLIPKVAAYCYKALVAKPDCCLDERFALGVARHTIRRPGTGWACIDQTNCYDGVRGYRGDDALWVPEGAACDAPRLLYIHGGSWMYGSPDSYGYGQLASKLSALSGAVVMMPDIPLLPISNYTGMLQASLEALRWLAETDPPGCKGPSTKPPLLFIAGDSAGGGTALSLMLELNMKPHLLPDGRKLAGGFFYSPWTNLMCNTPDYYDHAFAKIVDRNAFARKEQDASFDGDAYVGDIMFRGHPNENSGGYQLTSKAYVGGSTAMLTDPVASPMYAELAQLVGSNGHLPPLYFATGASESILGDSVIFAQKAAALGTKVQMDIFDGMWHVFPMYSEGCGFGESLHQAVKALHRSARHMRVIAETGKPPFETPEGVPYINYVYDQTLLDRKHWFITEAEIAQFKAKTQQLKEVQVDSDTKLEDDATRNQEVVMLKELLPNKLLEDEDACRLIAALFLGILLTVFMQLICRIASHRFANEAFANSHPLVVDSAVSTTPLLGNP